METKDAYQELCAEMGAHGLIDLGWTAALDNAKRRFGVCKIQLKEISLSRPLIQLNSDAEVRDTILHEIAHALAYELHGENCGHDHRWKEICERIGARPERCYNDGEVNQPDYRWALCHAETGEIFSTYQRKPTRDPSRLWMRGRKEETFGKLVYRINPKLATPSDDEQKNFHELAPIFGLNEKDFRRPFSYRGRNFFLIGLKPQNRKYPIIGINAEGQRYKFPFDVL